MDTLVRGVPGQAGLHTDFSAAAAYGFVRDLSEEIAPKTVREVVKVVRKCIEWNTETFDLKRMDSFRSVRTPKVRSGRVEFWTSDELERILENAPSDAFRAFWGLMAFAGLRFSEARFLKRASVRSGQGLVAVQRAHGALAPLALGKCGSLLRRLPYPQFRKDEVHPPADGVEENAEEYRGDYP